MNLKIVSIAVMALMGTACGEIYDGAGQFSPGSRTLTGLVGGTGGTDGGEDGEGRALSERCAKNSAVLDYSTQAELETLLDGVWEYCGGISPLSVPGHAGIELRPKTGKWYFLVRDPSSGELVRDVGFDSVGTLSIAQTTWGFELTLSWPSSGFITRAEFMDSPRRLRLNPSNYVRAE
jgi:hypothetical protein